MVHPRRGPPEAPRGGRLLKYLISQGPPGGGLYYFLLFFVLTFVVN